MEIKQMFKNAVNTAVKAFGSAFPNMGAGMMMTFGRTFTWNMDGSKAYNNKIFYSALNILVNKLTEPPILFSEIKNKNVSMAKYYAKNTSNRDRIKLKELALEEVEDHPLNALFDSPNTYQSGIELMEDFWFNYGLGDGFLFFEAAPSGRNQGVPVRVHSLNRSRVTPIRSNDAYDAVLRYDVTTLNGRVIPVDKEFILHMKKWNPNTQAMNGLSPADVAAQSISLNNANNEARGAAFVNGGRGTLFSSDVAITSQGQRIGKMTVPEMQELEKTIKSDFAGAKNNQRMHFTNSKVDAQSFGDTLAEMELVSAEIADWKYIFAVNGVPYVLAPVTEGATETNVRQGYKALVTNKIVPELRKFDHKLNQKIQQWWPTIVAVHDLTEFSELAPDLQLMQQVFGSPNLTVNELRAIYNYEKIEGAEGEMILIASALVPIQDAGLASAFTNINNQPGGDPAQQGNKKTKM